VFVGPQLQTLQQSNGWGVAIDNFQLVDESQMLFRDDTGTSRTFPFNAVFAINNGPNLVADASARFWVYMTDPAAGAGDEWGTSGAVILEDSSAVPIAAIDVAATSQFQYTIAYDTNAQAGHTPGTDIDVTVVAIGLEISLGAALERNYENA